MHAEQHNISCYTAWPGKLLTIYFSLHPSQVVAHLVYEALAQYAVWEETVAFGDSSYKHGSNFSLACSIHDSIDKFLLSYSTSISRQCHSLACSFFPLDLADKIHWLFINFLNLHPIYRLSLSAKFTRFATEQYKLYTHIAFNGVRDRSTLYRTRPTEFWVIEIDHLYYDKATEFWV